MSRLLLIYFLITLPAISHASGCTSYDSFRKIIQTISDDPRYDQIYDFQILNSDSNTVTINLTGAASPMTLMLDRIEISTAVSQPESKDLIRRDLAFTEGEGCGPIYKCVSGQYVLKTVDASSGTIKVFTFPRIDEFYSASGEVPSRWLADTVIPTFFGLSISGNASDKKQCIFGDW